MSKSLLAAAFALALTGCAGHYLSLDQQSCDRLTDWNDRKACKEKQATEERDWEKSRKSGS